MALYAVNTILYTGKSPYQFTRYGLQMDVVFTFDAGYFWLLFAVLIEEISIRFTSRHCSRMALSPQ